MAKPKVVLERVFKSLTSELKWFSIQRLFNRRLYCWMTVFRTCSVTENCIQYFSANSEKTLTHPSKVKYYGVLIFNLNPCWTRFCSIVLHPMLHYFFWESRSALMKFVLLSLIYVTVSIVRAVRLINVFRQLSISLFWDCLFMQVSYC